MKKRQKYSDGILHGLKIKEVAREGYYQIDELFKIKLEICLKSWFDLIIAWKIENKKKPALHYYDLKRFSHQLKQLLENEI